jgi:hypothetical protein
MLGFITTTAPFGTMPKIPPARATAFLAAAAGSPSTYATVSGMALVGAGSAEALNPAATDNPASARVPTTSLLV